MPVQFRCEHCRRMLSVSTKRGGTMLDCPACKQPVRVPTIEEVQELLRRKQEREETDSTSSETAAPAAKPAPESTVSAPVQRSVPIEREPLPSDLPSDSPVTSTPVAPVTADNRADEQSTEAPDEEEIDDEFEPFPEMSDAEIAANWGKRKRPQNAWSREAQDEPEEEDFQLVRRELDDSGLDMTPMVDVTFLLLIFFMITASFSLQKSMEVNPPQPEDEGAAQTVKVEEQEDDSVIVGISENDSFTVDDEPVSGISSLIDVLKAKKRDSDSLTSMTIELDPRASFGALVGVMDAGVTAGMQSIKRVTRPVDE